MDYGGNMLRSDSSIGWRYSQAVRGCLHGLDHGTGVTTRLHTPTHHQRAQPLCPNYPQTSLQPLPAKVIMCVIDRMQECAGLYIEAV